MRRLYPALAGILFLFTGCCGDPKSPAQVSDTLSRRYGGRPVNEFFAGFGLPSGEFESKNNRAHVYRWDSSQLHLFPQEARVMSSVSPAGRYEVVDTYRGVTQTHYCELRIYTDKEDDIGSFAVAVDTPGKWSASRCSELFSNP